MFKGLPKLTDHNTTIQHQKNGIIEFISWKLETRFVHLRSHKMFQFHMNLRSDTKHFLSFIFQTLFVQLFKSQQLKFIKHFYRAHNWMKEAKRFFMNKKVFSSFETFEKTERKTCLDVFI